MDSLQWILNLTPPHLAPASTAQVDVAQFIRENLRFEFVTGSEHDGTTTTLSGTADPEEVDLLTRHIATYLPGVNVAYRFRPRPMAYYRAQVGDTWETISQKAYGTTAHAKAVFDENHILYTGYGKEPDITGPIPPEEFVYLPRLPREG